MRTTLLTVILMLALSVFGHSQSVSAIHKSAKYLTGIAHKVLDEAEVLKRIDNDSPKRYRMEKNLISRYENGIKKNPNCHICYFCLGVFYNEMGGENSRAYFRKAAELVPDALYYQYALAASLATTSTTPFSIYYDDADTTTRRKDLEEGLSILRSVLEKDSAPLQLTVAYHSYFDFLLSYRLAKVDSTLYKDNLTFFKAQLKKEKKAEDFFSQEEWNRYQEIKKIYIE